MPALSLFERKGCCQMRIQMVLVTAGDQRTLEIEEHCVLDESDFELAVIVRQSIEVQSRNAVNERVVLPANSDSEVRITEVVTFVAMAVIKDEL